MWSCLVGGKFTTTAHSLFRSGFSHSSSDKLLVGSYVNSSTAGATSPGARVAGMGVAGLQKRSFRAAANAGVSGTWSDGGVCAVGLLLPPSRPPDESLGGDAYGAPAAPGGRVVVRPKLGRTAQMGDEKGCEAPMLHAAVLPHARRYLCACSMLQVSCCMLGVQQVVCFVLHSISAHSACCVRAQQR